MNQLQNSLELNHDNACKVNNALTHAFKTPEGIDVQVYGREIERGGRLFPKISLVEVSKE